MALSDIKPLSTYTYESVLPRLGYVQRTDDETGATNWYNLTPDEGTGRVRFEDGAPTDPGLQYAPQGLYEKDLRSQGYVPTDPYSLSYYAQFGQYGEGKGFGGDVRSYLDYVYGPGTTVIQDPTHGYLIKPADPARALEGGGTPVALPNRSGSFGDFLKEGALTIAPLATMAFAGPLAATLAGGTATAGSTIAANALLNAGIGALSGGNIEQILQKAGTGAALSGLAQAAPVTDAVASVKDVLMSSGITDPTLASKLASTLVSTAGSTAMTGLTGGDMTSALVSGALKLVPAALSGVKDSFTLRADSGDMEPSSMDVSVTPEAAFSPIGSTSSPQAEWTSGYDVPSMDRAAYSPIGISPMTKGDYDFSLAKQGAGVGGVGDADQRLTLPESALLTPELAYAAGIPYGVQSLGINPSADWLLSSELINAAGGIENVQVPPSIGQAAAEAAGLTSLGGGGVKIGAGGAGGAGQTTEGGVQNPGAGYIKSALDQLSQQGKYDDPSKRAYLSPAMISTGSPLQSMPMFQGIDPKLARILSTRTLAGGGTVDGPVDYVPGPEDRYYARHAKRGFAVRGPGTGQSDDIPTMLADGEYVIDSEVVSALGDGSNKAGAELLDKFREEIRKHKRSAPTDKIPPKAKSPLEYLKAAKGKKNG